MNKSLLKIIKATILSLIVAFLFTFIICFSLVMIGKEKFDMAIYLLNIVTVDEDNVQTITPVLEGNVLVNYPTYGTKYADLKIDSIGIDLPVYYGADYTILKSGNGHYETLFFSWESGSVIMAGHNFKTFFSKFARSKDRRQNSIRYNIWNI